MAKETKAVALTDEELELYANYVFSGKVEKEEDEKVIEELVTRSVTLGDATTLAKMLATQVAQQMTHQLVQVMERVQIQEIVLEKLGANGKTKKDAKVKYKKQLEEQKEKLIKLQSEMAETLEKEEE
ncbi:hypothetical protein [Bacillus phage vB_BceM_Bc431v3]|uniref:Uncharacterized protein n=1 Tax=Bacillus phage vB_BceM_Bc431v3 TaxID=1195072 RepID=M4HPE4_9CAUD|nr:hypothetical protein K201_gp189 [Bacillus phage vB_BceM_Bc431v3]AFQ96497.1 hypothetical protein [Bacillus phage vB_BceM_Bc431v3]